MKTLLIASAAAVLLTGSAANAQFLLGSDDKGHKQVTNMYAGQAERSARHAARISRGTVSAPSGAFLLGSDEKGHKAVANTYAEPRRSAARIPGAGGTFRARPGRISPGFLLGEDANGNKTVNNQYAR